MFQDEIKVVVKDNDKNILLDVEKIHSLLDEIRYTNKILTYFIAPLLIGIQVLLILK